MNYNKIDKEENKRNIEHKDLRGSVKKTYIHGRKENTTLFTHNKNFTGWK